MAEIHVNVGPNDKSGSQIVFHNPDNANGSQPLPPSDVPATGGVKAEYVRDQATF